jgi:hypothetical protein
MKFLKVIAITAAALGALALSSCSQSAPAAPPSYVAPAK